MSFPSFSRQSATLFANVFALVLSLSLLTGCPNTFSEFANKTSDEALFFKAQMYADDRDWTNAILAISQMSSAGRAERNTKAALASYYAGRCGLDLLDLASTLSSSLGSSTLYPTLLSEYKANSATNLADCQLAEDTILSISTSYSSLTADENIVLALAEFAKIGSILGANTLVDANGDGTFDGDADFGGTFDPCSSAHMSDLEVGKLGTGLIISINALSASGSSLTSSLTSAGSLTSALGNVQDPTAFSAGQIDILRSLIKTNEVGFNSCGGAIDSLNPLCHCP